MKINFYSVLKKSTIGLLLIYTGIVFSQATTPDCDCGEPENVWFKLQTENGVQRVVKLDMSKGKAFTDPEYIYLLLQDIDTKEMVYIIFPNGSDWTAEVRDPFLDALEKEFKSLEEYLRSKESKEIKKKQ
jgi:hypothetical protein